MAASGFEPLLNMEIRRLKPSEFDLLKQFSDCFIPNSDHSVVVVACEGEKLIGRTSIVGVPHVEGTYLEPEWRKGSLLKKLISSIEREAQREGIKQLLAYAPDKEVESYLMRLGYSKMSITVWEKRL